MTTYAMIASRILPPPVTPSGEEPIAAGGRRTLMVKPHKQK